MTSHSVLQLTERPVTGKKVRQVRQQGFVPGVLYGKTVVSCAVMVPQMVAEKVWRVAGRHQPIELILGAKKHLAMIKSAQFDPIKRTLRHLSLHVVVQNQPVETEVSIRIEGEGQTPAEKAGLVVLQTLEQITVKALPNQLPDSLRVPGDVLVAAGNTVTIADIVPVKGVEILAINPTVVVASVYEPAALAAQNDALAGESEDAVNLASTDNAGPSADTTTPQ